METELGYKTRRLWLWEMLWLAQNKLACQISNIIVSVLHKLKVLKSDTVLWKTETAGPMKKPAEK